jgi:hypothetical protein
MRTLRFTLPRNARTALLCALLGAALTACAPHTSPAASSTTASSGSGMAGMAGMSSAATPSAPMSAMSGMDEPMYTGNGLSASSGGFTLVPSAIAALPAGRAVAISYQIQDFQGMAVTSFQLDQTKLMHLYIVRSDLTGFQHVHPTMAADGTWTALLAAMEPGAYRAMAGMEHTLTATISKSGTPVTDLQPYLDTYAHLTAFHQGDLAFAHLHPQGTVGGDHGGPTLTFDASMTASGNYRLFLQFQTAGAVHTAAFTLPVS